MAGEFVEKGVNPHGDMGLSGGKYGARLWERGTYCGKEGTRGIPQERERKVHVEKGGSCANPYSCPVGIHEGNLRKGPGPDSYLVL